MKERVEEKLKGRVRVRVTIRIRVKVKMRFRACVRIRITHRVGLSVIVSVRYRHANEYDDATYDVLIFIRVWRYTDDLSSTF